MISTVAMYTVINQQYVMLHADEFAESEVCMGVTISFSHAR